MTGRGRYPKGDARYQEILRASIPVFTRQGYAKASVSEIARRCGISRAGLAHYFPTKEALYSAFVAWRDGDDWEGFPTPEEDPDGIGALSASVALMRHNMTIPGLIALRTTTMATAADPAHPAYASIKDQASQIVDYFIAALRRAREAGLLKPGVDEEALGITIAALIDGLQIRWLLTDQSFDIPAILEKPIKAALVEGTTFPRPAPALQIPSH